MVCGVGILWYVELEFYGMWSWNSMVCGVGILWSVELEFNGMWSWNSMVCGVGILISVEKTRRNTDTDICLISLISTSTMSIYILL